MRILLTSQYHRYVLFLVKDITEVSSSNRPGSLVGRLAHGAYVVVRVGGYMGVSGGGVVVSIFALAATCGEAR